jgi:outer membrane receptor protein involved in Fe transport
VGTFFTYQSGHWETVPAGSWAQDNFVTGPIDIDFYTGVNNYEMPAYIRLDLSARLKLKNRRHEQEISAGIYNVLNRHNASWLSYNASTGEWYQISLLPIMPSLKYLVSF